MSKYRVTYRGDGSYDVEEKKPVDPAAIIFGAIVVLLLVIVFFVGSCIRDANTNPFLLLNSGDDFGSAKDSGDFYDKFGNKYEESLIYIRGKGFFSTPYEDVYDLSGKYTTLSGTIFVPRDREEPMSGYNYSYVISIYGDGKCLYSSPEMEIDTPPVSFSVDVTGIQRLSIQYGCPDLPLGHDSSTGIGNISIR